LRHQYPQGVILGDTSQIVQSDKRSGISRKTALGTFAPLSGPHSITEEPGQRLKRIRERLNLRYRDVEEASIQIADRNKNDEFIMQLSRLSDIENKGTVPSIFRLYSLCTIYRLDFAEILEWYGVDLGRQPGDAISIAVDKTHLVGFSSGTSGEVQVPLALDPGLDPRRTSYLSRLIQKWGKLPLTLLNSLDIKNHRYAFIGSEDWTMYPLIQPGSLVLIDESLRKIVNSGWSNEFERPVYFLEHRAGFACSWCTLQDGQLVLQPHPASMSSPEVYRHPEDIEVIGQVTGIAMHLDPARRRPARA
jgi:transcriptional regulator with XRE-family HTH domain